MKKPQNNLVLTSLYVEREAYDRLKKKAIADGTTAAAMIRSFIQFNAREIALGSGFQATQKK
ncbi:MAG: hypothetical protein WCA19_02005 [Candidatus Acidiferrales bacterium]